MWKIRSALDLREIRGIWYTIPPLDEALAVIISNLCFRGPSLDPFAVSFLISNLFSMMDNAMFRIACALGALLVSVASAQQPGFNGRYQPPAFEYPQPPPGYAMPVDHSGLVAQQPGANGSQPGSTGDTIPLTPPEEVIDPTPSYYSVAYWCNPASWTNSFEFGLNGTEGNSQSASMRTGLNFEHKTKRGKLNFDLDYARTQANSIETQHNALLGIDNEWYFPDSPWTSFAKFGLEYDEFKAFDVRLVLNGGLGYTFFKSDAGKFAARFGSGTSREIGGPDNRWVPEAVLGLDFNRQITKKQKINFKTDYYPEWGDFTDYRMQAEANWEVLIDEEANLSLKFGIIDRYDSTPNNRRPNDIDYTAVILWKF